MTSQELMPVVSGAGLEPEMAQEVVDALLGIDLSLARSPEPTTMPTPSAEPVRSEQTTARTVSVDSNSDDPDSDDEETDDDADPMKDICH